ncbi:MAG: hypothetical protein R3F10_03035 [Lysobacteraceae bacterium]
MIRATCFALLAALSFGNAAFAQNYAPEADYDYAEVLAVEPIVEYNNAPAYREECWDQPVTYREPPRYVRQRRGSEAAAVLGGIVGGVIGHNIGGHGYHRHMATSAGAALGYAVVRDAQHDGVYVSGGREVTRYERRCAMRPTGYEGQQHVTGYDVTYRYHGRVYRTVTDVDPGPQLRVRVDVSAAP